MANITTQWGSEARPFSDFADQEIKQLLSSAASLAREIQENTGVLVFLSYGALLGAVREGRLIAHDFDIDFGFAPADLNSDSVIDATQKILNYLYAKGFEFSFETNGHFKASNHEGEYSVDVEFFASWSKENKFFSYFAVRGTVSTDQIFPLESISLNGIEFSCPRHPEALLQAIYGPDWGVPNSGFKYDLGPLEWEPFKFLFTKQSKEYWDSYYSKYRDNGVWLERPSSFALEVSKGFGSRKSLVEFGAGNGRDGLYFSQLGLDVTLCDYSCAALSVCNKQADESGLNIVTKQIDISDCLACSGLKNEFYACFEVVYARFFLHAISEIGEDNFLSVSKSILKTGGLVYLEFRALDKSCDRVLVYENGDHFRRLIDVDEFSRKAEDLGFKIVLQQQSYGLAVFRAEDPLIGRLVLKKL